jgi:hypothetical protein
MDSNVGTCCTSLDKRKGKAGEWRSETSGKKRYVYIQPEPPQSCNPLNVYKTQKVSFEDGTVYKSSV